MGETKQLAAGITPDGEASLGLIDGKFFVFHNKTQIPWAGTPDFLLKEQLCHFTIWLH